MIHKKILDVAQSNPNASLTGIAEHVSGASELFVERVLEEYGDPAKDRPQTKRADGHGENNRDTDTDTEETMTNDSPDQETELKVPDLTSEKGTERQSGTSTDLDALDGEVSAEVDLDASESKLDDTASAGRVTTDRSAGPDTGGSAPESEDRITDPSELTDKQWETLRAVHRDPTATQEEIAATLDVTRATVSKRVNEIDGFDWSNRRAFVKRLFDEEPSGGSPRSRNPDGSDPRLRDLESRVDSLENLVDGRADRETDVDWTPDLAHKMIHACLDAEYLSKEEEIKVLRQIL